MYNNLLTTVIKTVQSTVKSPNAYEELDASYDMMFNPQRYAEYREKRAKNEELGNKLILGATALAVTGELIHIVKKTGIVGKVLKR